MTIEFNHTLVRSLEGDRHFHKTATLLGVSEPSGKARLTYYVLSDFDMFLAERAGAIRARVED